jgi:phage terminase small subunit
MSSTARYRWDTLVNSMPADHFRAGDLPLLRAFCEAYAASLVAEKEIRKNGRYYTDKMGNHKKRPAVADLREQANLMAQLATKLRICASTRSGGRSKPEETKPKSKREGLMFGNDS